MALPIKCQPNAAGNCSNEQYSDTVNVKLLRAIPNEREKKNIWFTLFVPQSYEDSKLMQTSEETANKQPS